MKLPNPPPGCVKSLQYSSHYFSFTSLFLLDFMPCYFASTMLQLRCSVCEKKKRSLIHTTCSVLLTCVAFQSLLRATYQEAASRGEHPTTRFSAPITVLTLRQKPITQCCRSFLPDKNRYLFKTKKVEHREVEAVLLCFKL